ncbi:MAG: hypothetical protein UY75_C0001G0017 [Parcubacteria group bacterium GW2011_GWC2_52_8c]|nr:MAG: hypothetical protein UY75_C0001G0017 [Parcubacteria group bacterium GW2011_GWC2_52_8c]
MATIATTDQKARLLDLTTGILEMARDGNRDYEEVIEVFQVIKEKPNFATILGRNSKAVAPKPVPPLLEPVGTVTIPALADRFNAREKFVLNYGQKAKPGVRIAYLGDNFEEWFLPMVEQPTAEAVVSYSRLTRSELDRPILASLGNRPDLAIFLRQIYWLLCEQSNGEPGTLLNDGWGNIFYAPGLTRAVGVRWHSEFGGWRVFAGSVAGRFRWYVGDRVFSRNPA